MSVQSLSQALGHRFGVAAPPVLQSGGPGDPRVVFAHLAATVPHARPSEDVPREESFTLQVALKPITNADFWSAGGHVRLSGLRNGGTFLFDLTRNPRTMMHDSFDFVRFNISRRSIVDLAYRNGLRAPGTLAQSEFGAVDHVMHGLAVTARAALCRPQQVNALFLDHLAHAFHTHISTTYGRVAARPNAETRGLTPRQCREACAAMLDGRGQSITIDALASICGMSPRHFARAFRQSTGLPPHQWLLRARVERAAQMLRHDLASIADIAVACGFSDQSHLTRNFRRVHGQPPAEWRRKRLG